jgi:hypothetical protein
MGLLYGREGRLTAKNGGFRPGQGKIVNAGGPRTNFAKTSMYEGKAS